MTGKIPGSSFLLLISCLYFALSNYCCKHWVIT